MATLIVFVLLALTGVAIWFLIRLAVWYRMLSDELSRRESAAWLRSLDQERDREVRLWEYEALYERWDAGFVIENCHFVPGITTTLSVGPDVLVGYHYGPAGEYRQHFEPSGILPPEVPGAD